MYQQHKSSQCQPVKRARRKGRRPTAASWGERGELLRIEVASPASVHWSIDGWATTHDSATSDSGLGIHYVDIPTARTDAGAIDFTIRWTSDGSWTGVNYRIAIV